MGSAVASVLIPPQGFGLTYEFEDPSIVGGARASQQARVPSLRVSHHLLAVQSTQHGPDDGPDRVVVLCVSFTARMTTGSKSSFLSSVVCRSLSVLARKMAALLRPPRVLCGFENQVSVSGAPRVRCRSGGHNDWLGSKSPCREGNGASLRGKPAGDSGAAGDPRRSRPQIRLG